ncbi:MAG: class I SAM-dependent methyltransferase [Caldilinea sp. CFX5]|nr:class I SAM-dependent methyltransferase [Caldilinea sp. CFX5]
MHDFTPITETPGSGLNPEQLARIRQRYRFGAALAQGKDVLEVACGAGSGLGILRQQARCLVGCDYTGSVLRMAQSHYGQQAPLVCADAQQLPFADRCFDLLLSFEAIYYLPQIDWFLSEAHRLLRPDGVLLLGTSNPDWPPFVPGQMSVHYPTLPELAAGLAAAGFVQPQFYGAFPLPTTTRPHKALLATLRKVALHFQPFTADSALTRRLKQLVYGSLHPLPAELTLTALPNDDVRTDLTPLPATAADRRHRVLFAVAHKATVG